MPPAQKRKILALSALENAHTRPTKQPRLDAFFLPKIPPPSPNARPSVILTRDETARAEANDSPSPAATKKPPSTQTQEGAPQPALSDEQRAVLRMVVDEEKTLFFTGSAGTGKSLLLRAIIDALRTKFAAKPDRLAVCASTGIAAQNIGGTTIHAWGAVTPGMHDIGKLISFIKTCRPAHRRWKAVRVLIIDEVSMVDGQLFDTLAALATELRRKTSKPFGGIQLVVTGDFFQLPPVTPSGKEVCFAFQSSAWEACIEHTVTLTQVFRQKDSRFINLLDEMRKGAISPTAAQTLRSLSRPLLPRADGTGTGTGDSGGDHQLILPTELFPLRADVERSNAARLAALPGPARRFDARDSAGATVQLPPDRRRRLLDAMPAPARLELKRGAQVMLLRNVSETLVNGSVGRVLGFVRDPDAVPKGKAQGGGRKKKGEEGRRMEGRGGEEGHEGEEDEEEEEEQGKGSEIPDLLPVVEFGTLKGKETMVVSREEFRAEGDEGELLARRVQIPLVLAWAMSIHKAQGQTIQRVKVDLNKVFEKGQSYVALSRAATLDGLQVLGFDPRKVVAHPRVIEWSSAQTTCIGR